MNSNITVWHQIRYWNNLTNYIRNKSIEELMRDIKIYDEREKMSFFEKIRDCFQRGILISTDQYRISKRVLEEKLREEYPLFNN